MKGDISRQTFRPDKHYSAVLMQQGRVQLDADWNEQQAINLHRSEAETADVVGPTGAPRTAPGFSITPQGADLLIGRGHFYVDGILCENETDVLFTAQPDLRPIGPSLLPTANGLYVAYLEVWQRHITGLEDDQILESALGGPDTATRAHTVWQVRLLGVTNPGGSPRCDQAFTQWDQLLAGNLININNAGKMSARSHPEEQTPDPLCVLPPGARYRSLSNQLYRVEIHRGGDQTQATFKWSRDNGTVASLIETDPQSGQVINGRDIIVYDMGKDNVLSFASDPLPEWLELTDDRFELLQQNGTMAQVGSVNAAQRKITFAGSAALPSLNVAQHPLVRRWDQTGVTATADGVAMTGDWQELEEGVQVCFEPGVYRTGDYWLVPARTAVGQDSGDVQWPTAGGNPVPLGPEGTRHHFARLALVQRNASGFTLVPGGDCRRIFPPLTAITAADVSFLDTSCNLGVGTVQEALDLVCRRNGSMCTVLVSPGQDLAAAIATVPQDQDGMICLGAGTYNLAAPVTVQSRGVIVLQGCGAGSRLIAAQSETALVFNSCRSVTVRDCYVETGIVRDRSDLVGALTFTDCGTVTVEGVTIAGAGGPQRAATGITVRRSGPQFQTLANVRNCNLFVGHLQTGILVVNVDRIDIVDNILRAGNRPPIDQLLADPDYRAFLRRQLISNPVPGPAGAAPPAGTNATVTFNNQVLHFRTASGLVRGGNRNDTEWQRAINGLNPPGITSPLLLEAFLKRFAGQLLAAHGGGQGGSNTFRSVIGNLLEQESNPAASQGIAVGGTFAGEVRITGNTIQGAIQGIHIGLSRRETARGARLQAGPTLIRDNNIQVRLPSSATRERHGIFVGGCESLILESNHISLQRSSFNANLRVEAVRLFGDMGQRVIVRQNHIRPAFAAGIVFAPLNQPLPARPMWVISENDAEQAGQAVNVPARTDPGGGVPSPNAVRRLVRGIPDNFS